MEHNILKWKLVFFRKLKRFHNVHIISKINTHTTPVQITLIDNDTFLKTILIPDPSNPKRISFCNLLENNTCPISFQLLVAYLLANNITTKNEITMTENTKQIVRLRIIG